MARTFNGRYLLRDIGFRVVRGAAAPDATEKAGFFATSPGVVSLPAVVQTVSSSASIEDDSGTGFISRPRRREDRENRDEHLDEK
jgi:hypothetical protein